MDIYISGKDNYLSYSIKKELESKGNDNRSALAGAAGAISETDKLDSSRNNESGLKASDRIDISREAREMQQVLRSEGGNPGAEAEEGEYSAYQDKGSRLSQRLSAQGREDDDKRLAYLDAGDLKGNAKSKGKNPDDEVAKLQEQLREAVKKLQEAQQELTAAQSASISQVSSAQNGETPDASASNADAMAAEQEKMVAQQKVSAASAEVNELQQQLEKAMKAKLKGTAAAAAGGANPGITVGAQWAPKGTNDYVSGNW